MTQKIETNKKKLYYVETDCGCGIRTAESIEQATRDAVRECGTDNFKRVQEATEENVEWVRAMGGYIPD